VNGSTTDRPSLRDARHSRDAVWLKLGFRCSYPPIEKALAELAEAAIIARPDRDAAELIG
jgi:hypothetical protein